MKDIKEELKKILETDFTDQDGKKYHIEIKEVEDRTKDTYDKVIWENGKLYDLLSKAWAVIANVNHGDWNRDRDWEIGF